MPFSGGHDQLYFSNLETTLHEPSSIHNFVQGSGFKLVALVAPESNETIHMYIL